MKTLLLLLVAALCGCSIRLGKSGFSSKPVTPPANAAVRVTVRNIGIHAGQNQATQTPEVNIGYQSTTYDRIPTSVGTNIFIAPVKAGIGVMTEGFAPSITETIETGK